MTTIAAAWTPWGGAVAGDRRVTYGAEAHALADPKVYRVAPWLLLGVSGSARDMRWVRSLRLLSGETPTDADEALDQLVHLAEPWRTDATDHGDERHGVALAVTPWGIFRFDSSGEVCRLGAPYAAIGTGADFARGAMLSRPEVAPNDAVALGVTVAASCDVYTSPEHDVLFEAWP